MSDPATAPSDAKSGGKRSTILVGLLAVLLAALAYDYLVARAGVDSAYDKITQRSTEVNQKSTEVFTDTDVQDLLGRKPSRTFNDAKGDQVEVYSWRAGVPFKTHDLFVVYKPSSGRQMFYRHAKFVYETSEEVAPDRIYVPDEDDESNEDYYARYGYGSPTGDNASEGADQPKTEGEDVADSDDSPAAEEPAAGDATGEESPASEESAEKPAAE